MMRIAILISGSGSNMISLCNSMLSENFASPVLVLSDRKAAKGLSAARELGIKTRCIEYSNFYDDHGSFEKSLLKELLSVKPDLICLAGFLRVLSKSFINSFPKKIINIDIFSSHKYLKNKNLEQIIFSQKLATENVFLKKNIPFRSFELIKRDEKTLGELFCFFILETILLGRALKINPYDQPSVELIKQETNKILI